MGNGKKELLLMNKNTPVLAMLYDYDSHVCREIRSLKNPEYAPPAIALAEKITADVFNDWWRNRAIPVSRDGLSYVMDRLKIRDTRKLLEINHGLSLSDRYWITDGSKTWEEINFFENDFNDELGMITLLSDTPKSAEEGEGLQELAFLNPSSSLNGDMKKKWSIAEDGTRVLYKKSKDALSMECYAEKVATALYERIFEEGEYVPYDIKVEDGNLYAVCPNMLRENEELVPAYDIVVNAFSYSDNTFKSFVKKAECLKIDGCELFLNKMFLADFLIGNYDRHYRNFGFIRNVETLEYVRMAPVFDSGKSLWSNVGILEAKRSSDYYARPFGNSLGEPATNQIKQLPSLDCIDLELVTDFTEDVREILRENDSMSSLRLDKIIACIENQKSTILEIRRNR